MFAWVAVKVLSTCQGSIIPMSATDSSSGRMLILGVDIAKRVLNAYHGGGAVVEAPPHQAPNPLNVRKLAHSEFPRQLEVYPSFHT